MARDLQRRRLQEQMSVRRSRPVKLTRSSALTAACVAAMLAMPGAANALTCADYFEAGTYGVDGQQNDDFDSPGYACNLGSNSNTPDDIEDVLAAALGNGWSRLD